MHTLGDLERLELSTAEELVEGVLVSSIESRVCLTCSFQAEDIIVLDLLRKRIPGPLTPSESITRASCHP